MVGHKVSQGNLMDGSANRVNLTATIRPTIKRDAELLAAHDNTSASRVVENALLAYYRQREDLLKQLRLGTP
jgi:hypothetical protein